MKRRVAPRRLSTSSRELWHVIVKEWQLEAHQEAILCEALACLDRAQEARAVLDVEGLTVKDRFDQIKEHPLCSVERMNRLAFARLLRELGLDLTDIETRPPRIGGSKW